LTDELRDAEAKWAEEKKKLEQDKYDEIAELNKKFEAMASIHEQTDTGEKEKKYSELLDEKS